MDYRFVLKQQELYIHIDMDKERIEGNTVMNISLYMPIYYLYDEEDFIKNNYNINKLKIRKEEKDKKKQVKEIFLQQDVCYKKFCEMKKEKKLFVILQIPHNINSSSYYDIELNNKVHDKYYIIYNSSHSASSYDKINKKTEDNNINEAKHMNVYNNNENYMVKKNTKNVSCNKEEDELILPNNLKEKDDKNTTSYENDDKNTTSYENDDKNTTNYENDDNIIYNNMPYDEYREECMSVERRDFELQDTLNIADYVSLNKYVDENYMKENNYMFINIDQEILDKEKDKNYKNFLHFCNNDRYVITNTNEYNIKINFIIGLKFSFYNLNSYYNKTYFNKKNEHNLLITLQNYSKENTWFPTLSKFDSIYSKCSWLTMFKIHKPYFIISSNTLIGIYEEKYEHEYVNKDERYGETINKKELERNCFVYKTTNKYAKLFPHQICVFAGTFDFLHLNNLNFKGFEKINYDFLYKYENMYKNNKMYNSIEQYNKYKYKNFNYKNKYNLFKGEKKKNQNGYFVRNDLNGSGKRKRTNSQHLYYEDSDSLNEDDNMGSRMNVALKNDINNNENNDNNNNENNDNNNNENNDNNNNENNDNNNENNDDNNYNNYNNNEPFEDNLSNDEKYSQVKKRKTDMSSFSLITKKSYDNQNEGMCNYIKRNDYKKKIESFINMERQKCNNIKYKNLFEHNKKEVDADDEITYHYQKINDKRVPNIYIFSVKDYKNELIYTNLHIGYILRNFLDISKEDFPYDNLIILYLPIEFCELPSFFYNSENIESSFSCHIYDDIKNGYNLFSNSNILNYKIIEPYIYMKNNKFFIFGNVLIFPTSILHNIYDVLFNMNIFSYKIIIAEGLLSLCLQNYTDTMKNENIYFLYMLKSFMLQKFIETMFGNVEINVIFYELRERYCSLVELLGDINLFHSYEENKNNISQEFPSHYIFNNLFYLKCFLCVRIFFNILKNFPFCNTIHQYCFFLFFNYFKSKGKVIQSTKFWKKVFNECTRRYIENYKQLPKNKFKIKSPDFNISSNDLKSEEHEQYQLFEKYYVDFFKTYIKGYGICQYILTFNIHLQRKGTSMDNFNFLFSQNTINPFEFVDRNYHSNYFLADLSSMIIYDLLELHSYLSIKNGTEDIIKKKNLLCEHMDKIYFDKLLDVPCSDIFYNMEETYLLFLKKNFYQIDHFYDAYDRENINSKYVKVINKYIIKRNKNFVLIKKRIMNLMKRDNIHIRGYLRDDVLRNKKCHKKKKDHRVNSLSVKLINNKPMKEEREKHAESIGILDYDKELKGENHINNNSYYHENAPFPFYYKKIDQDHEDVLIQEEDQRNEKFTTEIKKKKEKKNKRKRIIYMLSILRMNKLLNMFKIIIKGKKEKKIQNYMYKKLKRCMSEDIQKEVLKRMQKKMKRMLTKEIEKNRRKEDIDGTYKRKKNVSSFYSINIRNEKWRKRMKSNKGYILKKKQELINLPYSNFDSLDLIGRDGNFYLGFGYVGSDSLLLSTGKGNLYKNIIAYQKYKNYNLQKLSEICIDKHNICEYNTSPFYTSCIYPQWKTIFRLYYYLLLLKKIEKKKKKCLTFSNEINLKRHDVHILDLDDHTYNLEKKKKKKKKEKKKKKKKEKMKRKI
ncbi:hypothetical protein PFFVO_01832 [Plasmodium falciparum Vietnam Oak-Knoll (FVO)]|uniref:Uncharacterized protein n=1 Tax=Plasmodium falciparum Vietnam Oak-Knoll (FVO) TaxID=1036723 RepID=A0A024V9Y2_PLAFA|nr:hypothetical protein PFFVO_01832 [Plasmodium falciparum Vietnam Oak-Knoll (FVO)]